MSNAAEETSVDEKVLEGKELIYSDLGEMVKEMTGKRVGKSGGRKIFDAVVEKIFAEAAEKGSFRFNAGYGSLHVRTYGAGSRRLPSGQTTTFGERKKMRYEEGVSVSSLVSGDAPGTAEAEGDVDLS